jgi:hypothetical protein
MNGGGYGSLMPYLAGAGGGIAERTTECEPDSTHEIPDGYVPRKHSKNESDSLVKSG